MAQKKLLLVLAVLIPMFLMANSNVEAGEGLLAEHVAEADRDRLKGLIEESREIVMSAIAEKYRELLMLRQQRDGVIENKNLTGSGGPGRDYRDSVLLKVFISSSMDLKLLKTYVRQARRYGGVLVFNGLPDNSWVKLNKTVTEIVGDEEGVGIQIDPEEFDRFNIKTVPAFVLIKEADLITGTSEELVEDKIIYDKVTGNILTHQLNTRHNYCQEGRNLYNAIMSKSEDFRKLSISAQASMRKIALKLVKRGESQSSVGELIGVSRQTVNEWVRREKRGDKYAISGKLRGRKIGEKRLITEDQSKIIQGYVNISRPEDHNIKSALWSRKSVNALIKKHCGFFLPLSTIGEYLRRWGYTAQKPKKLAYEQQPKRVQFWLDEEYPSIAKQAEYEKAEIHWCDEVGIKQECQVLQSYSLKGKTPVVIHKSKRFSINMISTVTNNGKLRFMLYEETLKTNVFIEFLRRLVKYSKKKIFLILDNLKVHHSKKVQIWTRKHKKKISLFFLPPYTPQHNPDEYLNNDLKRNVNRKHIPLTKSELQGNLKSYLRTLQNNPEHIKRLFQAKEVKYAA
ncbi:IS630 family transposase [Candidatus Megaera polyxenophila]|uniref:IS630 family transposase n=1 Tax=Candidatus Megaera polyxenophila TaxID=988779 RepID=UPI00249E7D66|nr:IS630 family transposase [Candidatus Megaera polyxenophila]